MEIGPANPVVKQFRINSWSTGTVDSSANAETGAPPDTDRPTHKLRTALGLPPIPPVAVELPEAQPTRPASVADKPQGDTQGGNAQKASMGLPVDGRSGLQAKRNTPTTGGTYARGIVAPPKAELPAKPGAMTQARPQLSPLASQQIKQSLVTPAEATLPESGPLSEGRPLAPQFTGLTAPGIATYNELIPQNTSSLPPLPLAELPEEATFADGTPRTEDDVKDITATRAQVKEARAERQETLDQNRAARAAELQARAQALQVRDARRSDAPPSNGAEQTLTEMHKAPPFDPAARSDLDVKPRKERGRVARKDSVLYDQVGASLRVDASARRADKAVDRQREVGRREFEMRQRRNAEGVREAEARAAQRRETERQRLEAADLQEITAQIEARKAAIQNDFVTQESFRNSERGALNAGMDGRKTTSAALIDSARREQDAEFRANAGSQARAVKARQREVFALQMNYAEERRFLAENPLNKVGDESQENLALSRTGEEKFKDFRADSAVLAQRLEEGRAEAVATRDADARGRDEQKLVKARERSQGIRRRLQSTYAGDAQGASGQSRGRL